MSQGGLRTATDDDFLDWFEFQFPSDGVNGTDTDVKRIAATVALAAAALIDERVAARIVSPVAVSERGSVDASHQTVFW